MFDSLGQEWRAVLSCHVGLGTESSSSAMLGVLSAAELSLWPSAVLSCLFACGVILETGSLSVQPAGYPDWSVSPGPCASASLALGSQGHIPSCGFLTEALGIDL